MEHIEILEVGPRDGFQNVKEYIPLETKLQIIDGLVAAGLRQIQITSFVSPKAVPQMRDAAEVVAYCRKKYPDTEFHVLVPNRRGGEAAFDSGIRNVSYVVSLSESHNRANTRRSHQESLAEVSDLLRHHSGTNISIDLATTFGCPFEGYKGAQDVVPFLRPWVDAGISTVNLCDTIGIAHPAQVRETVQAVRQAYPGVTFQIHIHDTRNMGMVNTLAAIEQGIITVQSTLGGLGGCPFAPGASGNLATEDLAFMLSGMGYDVGVDVGRLVELSRYQHTRIPGGQYSGHLFLVPDTAAGDTAACKMERPTEQAQGETHHG